MVLNYLIYYYLFLTKGSFFFFFVFCFFFFVTPGNDEEMIEIPDGNEHERGQGLVNCGFLTTKRFYIFGFAGRLCPFF